MTAILSTLSRVAVLCMVTSVLAACGGGGGGGGGNTAAPPPADKTISGVVMLGPVAGADVEVRGTTGVLATSTTDANGSFGPLAYTGTYNGPLRITVTGNATSTWICDFRAGCSSGGVDYAFANAIPFDGTLEAVLPTADASSFVSVSMLSNFVAARMEALGGLTSGNINNAYIDTATAIRTVLTDALDSVSASLPDNFGSIELYDLSNLPAPGGPDSELSVLLTLLNSGFEAYATPVQTTGEFIDDITARFAALSSFPIAGQRFTDPSQESFVLAFLLQATEILNQDGATSGDLDALLSPITLSNVIDAAFNTYLTMPALRTTSDVLRLTLDDGALAAGITRNLMVTTSTGELVQVSDLDSLAVTLDGIDWLQATVVDINNTAHLRITIDMAAAATLSNGSFSGYAEVSSAAGAFRRAGVTVIMTVNLVGQQVFAGPDEVAFERSSLQLQGSTSSPSEVQSVNWVQVSGPTATITGGDTFTPTIDLPSIPTDAVVTMRLDVVFNDGLNRSDLMDIVVQAYPNISDISLGDPILQQCVTDAAAASGAVDAPELTSLTCTGVSNVSGLDVFTGITSLELQNNTLANLDAILLMTQLQYLNLAGNPALPCDQVDELAIRLDEGTELIVSDTCVGGLTMDLGASGFDLALDESTGHAYVSIPARNEVAVISLAEARIIDRFALPGTPYGIDASLDGARVFAALNGSNAVAVINVAQRTVTTIDLGISVDHPTTYDVIEGETDRLFVTANPGSGGFAYVAQVRLDQANLASRVASNTIIRARPILARSPQFDFVYVGSGFSPNSLYKLSLADPDAGIILEDDHGSVGGTDNLSVNIDGTRIALGSGQVLRTGSFVEEGRVTAGRSVASPISNTLFVQTGNGIVDAFDFSTLENTNTIETRCIASSSRIAVYDNDAAFAFLQGDTVCLHAQFSRTTPPDPFAALRVPDLALEECVIDTAIASGFTQPDEFTELDCSATTRTILSLDGIDQFVNLATLNLSNSSIVDLTLLGNLPALHTLALRDANVSLIDALFNIGSLTTVDLSGNPDIICSDLDQLVATGVAVTATSCADTVRIELGGIGRDLALDLANDRAFVSIPSLNRVAEVSLTTGGITNNFGMPASPNGIDLASDGTTIYAALGGVGDLGVLDTTDGSVESIDLSIELDNDATYDVAEVSTNRVVVSTSPGSSGFGYIVEVRRDLANAARRVASNRIIRAGPVIEVAPDGTAVFVGEGFSPNSLYKLDATQDDMPIVAEDSHGDISGTSHLAISPDGSRIYLTSGQAVSTATISRVGQYAPGISTVTADGTSLLVGDAQADVAREYSIATTGQTGTRAWGCNILNVRTLREYGDGIIVLGEDLLCYSRTVPYP